MDTPIKTIFCANCQAETKHGLSASPSGEIQANCEVCGRLLKFPADVKPEDFQTLIDAHKEANVGQVTVESINKKLADFADKTVTPAKEATPKK
jgi:hypothetical protein